MTNQSKVNDPRMWMKWKNSGAVGTIEDAILTVMQRDRVQRFERVNERENSDMHSSDYVHYVFQIESVPGVGRVVFRQGGTAATYSSEEGPYCEKFTSADANVAGIAIPKTRKVNYDGNGFIPISLFDERKDAGLIEKVQAFLKKEKGVTGTIAFQT